jgi:hypothetical protein
MKKKMMKMILKIEESEMVLVKEGSGLNEVVRMDQCLLGKWGWNECLYRRFEFRVRECEKVRRMQR